MFLDRSVSVFVVVLIDKWNSSARASMTRSLTGCTEGFVDCSFRKSGNVCDKTRIKMGVVGVAIV